MSSNIDPIGQSAAVFSQKETGAVVSIGIVAGVIPALQPILLGGLNQAGQLTSAEIGRAGMVEGLGMLLGSFLATLLLAPRMLRPLSIAALVVMVVANALTASSSGNAVLLLRALNGAASGVILWVLVGMLTRASDGARLFAIYVTAGHAADCRAVAAVARSGGIVPATRLCALGRRTDPVADCARIGRIDFYPVLFSRNIGAVGLFRAAGG